MKNIFRFLALVSCSYTISINAFASTLLWESSGISAGGTWSGVSVPSSIIGMQFYFGYAPNNSAPWYPVPYANGTYAKVDEQALDHLIGGNKYFMQGETGVFDFDATTSPAFSEVSAKLTNGEDEVVNFGGFGYNQDGIVTGGAGTSGLENLQYTNLWPTQTQQHLLGASIDYYRLTVSNVTWGTNGTGFSILGTAKWQVYGTAAPIPEPESYAMMLVGLGLVGFMVRRKQQSA